MTDNLKGKVAVITGASQGLGRCLCNYLSDLGVKVVAIARNNKKLKTLESEISDKGSNILSFKLDVTDYNGIKKTVSKIVNKLGTIDILINNAGISRENPLEKLGKEDIDLVIDTNLKGTIYFTRHIAPVMMKSKKGYIINISSIAGIRGYNTNGTYSASKFGINGFGESISKYLMKHNIHVVNLNPGGINTTWWDRDDYIGGDREKIIKPIQIAKLIEFILNGDPCTVFRQVTFLPVNEIEEI